MATDLIPKDGRSTPCKYCDKHLPRVKGSDGIYRHPNAVPGLNLRCGNQEAK